MEMMDRRGFLESTAAGTFAFAGCGRERNEEVVAGEASLGGMPLAELRALYQYDLFDDFLPFLAEHVIDHELGGFMCSTDRSGKNLNTNKTTWYEGRGIWVYSFLHNKVKADPIYLEIARKSVEFILPKRPADDQLWPASFTREGKPLGDRAGDIYGGLFVANGLAEYSKAAGNEEYWQTAKDVLRAHVALYDRPDYEYPVIYGPEIPTYAGPRVLGHWMVLLRLATQMLETASVAFVEEVAERSLEAILDRHYNPEFGLLNEVLHHDLSRPTNGLEQFSYTGHAIETLWMVMFEAARRKDVALHDRAAEMFRRHVEVAWDPVYGGFFRSLDHVDRNLWKTDKVLWLQEEVLIGALHMIERSGDAWAREWFDRTYAYVREKFPLKQYGFPLWILGADRKVTFEPDAARVGNFHHPRHLMINLLALDRMMAKGGSA
jgi:mannose/cellobiose epimerase-like protein (N-acyl-D-glucosamine 2-epimerase family)